MCIQACVRLIRSSGKAAVFTDWCDPFACVLISGFCDYSKYTNYCKLTECIWTNLFCTFFKSSLHYFECVFYLLFQNRIPHRDRQQAVNIVGYGASLNKQEECDHHCHTRAQPCQVTARNLHTGEKYQLNKTFGLCRLVWVEGILRDYNLLYILTCLVRLGCLLRLAWVFSMTKTTYEVQPTNPSTTLQPRKNRS